ncbi:unknown [Bacteroides sp. CAG:709]|nr:unknown [Bacteroides sp. CAG:709]
MNKINFAFALALTFMAAVACDKNKVVYDMTDAARAAMDRLVGEYELVGAEWDGAPVDLNDDGVASASIFDELKEVPDLTDEIGIEIDMTAPYRTSVRISLLIEEIYLNTSIAFWNKSIFTPKFSVDSSGNYDLGIDPYYGKVSDDSRCQGYFYKMNVRLEGDDILYLSGYTVLRDDRSGQPVNGTLTYKFKCVSGKGKNEIKS